MRCWLSLWTVCVAALVASTTAVVNTDAAVAVEIAMMMEPLEQHVHQAIQSYRALHSSSLLLSQIGSMSPRHSDPDICDNALEDWLAEITFEIPDFTFTVSDVDCTISNLVCFGIDLASIDSAYVNPQLLKFGFSGLGTTCDGDWAYKKDTFPKMSNHGSLTMLMTDATLDSSVFVGKEEEFPTHMNVTECVLSDIKFTLDFHDGGIVGWLLDLMSAAIERIMENAMKKVICQGLETLINVNATNFINDTLNPMLHELVAYGPSEPEELYGMIDWSNDTKLETASVVLDTLLNPASEGHWNDGINTIMESLTEDGVITIETSISETFPVVDPTSGPLANITIDVHSATLSGLTSFTEFVLIRPSNLSAQSLETVIAMEEFGAVINMTVTVDLSQMAISGCTLREEFEMTVKTSDVNLATNLVLGIPEGYYPELYMDQLSEPGCLFGGVKAMTFTSLALNLTVDQILVEQFTVLPNSLESDIDDLVNNVLQLLTTDFKWLITNVINGAMQGPVREGINNRTQTILDAAEAEGCTPHVHQNETHWLMWNESKVISTMNNIVNDLIGPDGMNGLIDAILPNGTLHLHLPLSGKMIVSVDLVVSGLGSFYELEMWCPSETYLYDIDSNLGIGYCGDDWCQPLDVALYITTTTDTVRIALNLENFHMFSDWLAQHDTSKLANLQLSQLTEQGCLVSTFDQIALRQFTAIVSQAIIQIDDKKLNITDGDHSLQEFLQRIHFNESLNANIEEQRQAACDACAGVVPPHHHSSTSENDWVMPLSLVIAGSVGSLVIFIYMYFKYRKDKQKRKEAEAAGRAYPQWHELWDFRHTLVCNPAIPLWVRIAIPIVLVGTMGMFVSSNIDVGASVEMELTLNDKKIKPDPLFEFGLANSVEDMWEAKVYTLSILIAVFSGGWPYLKLFLMLVAWCTPALVLPPQKREQLLCYLDALGKWSLVDAYVLVLMMVAFRFHLAMTKGDNKAIIDVIVIPHWGIYGFMLATMISLAMSHIILAFHRNIEEKRILPDTGPLESLSDHSFRLHDGTRVRATTAGKIVVLLSIAFTAAIICAGVWIESFAFEFEGLTGYLLGDDAEAPYSLIKIGDTLPSVSGSPNDFGVRWLQATYFTLGVGMPLALTVVLAIIWLKPLSLTTQRQLYVLSEVLNAWSGLEVLVISVVAALLEISQFAQFIIGDSCDEIDKILKKYMYDELDGNATCFDVIAKLEGGCWALFMSAFLLICVLWPITRMCHAALEERMDRECVAIDLSMPLVDVHKNDSYYQRHRSSENAPRKEESKSHIAMHIYRVLERCGLVHMERPILEDDVDVAIGYTLS